MIILQPIIYALSHILILFLGIGLGYFIYSPESQMLTPPQIKDKLKNKVNPPKAQVVKRPTARDIIRKETLEGKEDQAMADTFSEYLKL